MGSLVIVLFWLCYFGLSLWAAIALNSSMRKAGWRIKFPGFYFVILPVWGIALWDAPLHEWNYHQFCKNESGLKIIKTPEAWEKENGETLKSLDPKKRKSITVDDEREIIILNERFALFIFNIKRNFRLIERKKEIRDTKTNELMAYYKNMDTGPLHELPFLGRIWLNKRACPIAGEALFWEIKEIFENSSTQRGDLK
ncbi:hypothetical protein [Allofranklinella schreckenbergeri]|uniref:hypothetical protein n=1 Tax=Allofranklinella schreckenbergeri TaxID=1076744 RepID=UPI0011C3EA63|nr:hypothetical protein [Allofranklinella schreckenbergeri]